jgi:hypothetical protein
MRERERGEGRRRCRTDHDNADEDEDEARWAVSHARTMEEMVVLNLGSNSTTATLSNAAGGSN